MNEIQLNHEYTTKALCETLGITYNTFKAQKEKYLKSLSSAYKYTCEKKGRNVMYTFTEQIADFVSPRRKGKVDRNNKVVQEYIYKTIAKDPMQTAANINRLAWENAETNPSSVALLNLKPETTKRYIGVNLKEMYGTVEQEGGTHGKILQTIWGMLDKEHNRYIEMTEEQVDELSNYFDKMRKSQKKVDMKLVGAYKSDLISRKQFQEGIAESTLNAFHGAQVMFYEKHGYYPVRVAIYLNKELLEELGRA